MLMSDIHSVILQNDTYTVYTLSANPGGISSLSTSNSRVFTRNAFWHHRIDGHEPLVIQAFTLISYYGMDLQVQLDYSCSDVEALLLVVCDASFFLQNRGG